MATAPTPSTVSRTRLICLSAISVVSRMFLSLATAIVRTGSRIGIGLLNDRRQNVRRKIPQRPRDLFTDVLGGAFDISFENKRARDLCDAFRSL